MTVFPYGAIISPCGTTTFLCRSVISPCRSIVPSIVQRFLLATLLSLLYSAVTLAQMHNPSAGPGQNARRPAFFTSAGADGRKTRDGGSTRVRLQMPELATHRQP